MGSGPLVRKKNLPGDRQKNVGTSAHRGNNPGSIGPGRIVAGLALELCPPSSNNPEQQKKAMAEKDAVVHTVIVMGASVRRQG